MVNKDNTDTYIHLEFKSTQKALKETIAQFTENCEEYTTAIPELLLFRRNEPTQLTTTLYEPSVCMVVQGSKRITLGDDTYVYDADHYLITSIHLPTTVQIIQASRKNPFLGLRLKLDPREISQLMVDGNLPLPSVRQSTRGMATGKITLPLLSAFKRLVELLIEERDIPILAPLIQREIIYHLLMGEQSVILRQIASTGSQSNQIAKVIEWLKTNFKEPLSVDDLTKKACMSNSTFHHHFRSLTAMSPVQYIKMLRLHEARRLMLTEHLDATNASFQVGYDSPSQFSREYKRQFGESPLRDIKKLSMEFNAEPQ